MISLREGEVTAFLKNDFAVKILISLDMKSTVLLVAWKFVLYNCYVIFSSVLQTDSGKSYITEQSMSPWTLWSSIRFP